MRPNEAVTILSKSPERLREALPLAVRLKGLLGGLIPLDMLQHLDQIIEEVGFAQEREKDEK
jgi:hypothetical protein